MDPPRLAQLLAVPHAHLEAERRGLLVIGPQLLPRRRLQQRPQLFAGAANDMTRRGSSVLRSWPMMIPCSSPLSLDSAIATRAPTRRKARGGAAQRTTAKTKPSHCPLAHFVLR